MVLLSVAPDGFRLPWWRLPSVSLAPQLCGAEPSQLRGTSTETYLGFPECGCCERRPGQFKAVVPGASQPNTRAGHQQGPQNVKLSQGHGLSSRRCENGHRCAF